MSGAETEEEREVEGEGRREGMRREKKEMMIVIEKGVREK